jgi:hypothetical protein
MSKAWLKPIGTDEDHCPDSYNVTNVDFSAARRPVGIRPGHRVVLYAVGKSRVFAIAEVTSEIYASGRERFPYRRDIRYLLNLPVLSGVLIDQVNTPERDLRGLIRFGNSYFKLKPAEYKRAVALLNWTDARIADAFDCRTHSVECLRERLVTEGFEVALHGKPKSRVRSKVLDGEQEAKIIALRLGSPPKGFANWTLRLADRRDEVCALVFAFVPEG